MAKTYHPTHHSICFWLKCSSNFSIKLYIQSCWALIIWADVSALSRICPPSSFPTYIVIRVAFSEVLLLKLHFNSAFMQATIWNCTQILETRKDIFSIQIWTWVCSGWKIKQSNPNYILFTSWPHRILLEMKFMSNILSYSYMILQK